MCVPVAVLARFGALTAVSMEMFTDVSEEHTAYIFRV
jgi:hypothetical protein